MIRAFAGRLSRGRPKDPPRPGWPPPGSVSRLLGCRVALKSESAKFASNVWSGEWRSIILRCLLELGGRSLWVAVVHEQHPSNSREHDEPLVFINPVEFFLPTSTNSLGVMPGVATKR